MKKRVILMAAVLAVWAPVTLADTPLQSPNYQISESFIGGGGLVTENSANYSAGESIGGVASNTSSSASFQATSGYTTTADPALQFIVNSSNINLGQLSSTTTSTATISFSVLDYTSYGYNVIIVGSPPSNGQHTLAAMTTTGPSQTGVEQFGLNLRANTSPVAFGADPSGGFGTAATGYNVVNQYRYNSGEVIATSAKSSGLTNFTGSYIVNASVTTSSGSYSGTQTLICVGTY